MTAEKFKRKLTAILSADVKGYRRLMGTDEETTLRTLQEYKGQQRKKTNTSSILPTSSITFPAS
jgi:hypothetical protein